MTVPVLVLVLSLLSLSVSVYGSHTGSQSQSRSKEEELDHVREVLCSVWSSSSSLSQTIERDQLHGWTCAQTKTDTRHDKHDKHDKHTNVCKWHGIKCTGDKITKVDLSELGLSGTLPEELSLLPSLRFLHLDHNKFTGTIPSSYGALTGLQELFLHRNQLEGPIPPSIGDLKNVKSMYLNDNSFTGTLPSSLGNLESCVHLVLHSNRFHGSIPEALGNLVGNIQTVDLAENSLTGVIPYSACHIPNLFTFNNSIVNDCASLCTEGTKCKNGLVTNEHKGRTYQDIRDEPKWFVIG